MKLPRISALTVLFTLLASLMLSGCHLGDVLSEFTEDDAGGDLVTIAYAEAPSSYSPLSYAANDRKFLANVYEPLVRYDKTFNFKTGLAVSWGRLDDYTWDFRLREGVIFHDGSEFEVDDVVYSLELAMGEGSDLASLLSKISIVEGTDDGHITITTSEPDPLLLHKLINVYIVPEAYDDFDTPVGTGAYSVLDANEDTIMLSRFDSYWGAGAYFQEAHLKYIPDADERNEAILSGEIDVLANVPPQYVGALREEGVILTDLPSLEVSFLMINKEGALADEALRTAVWWALSMDYGSSLGSGYLDDTSQIAATGISGYFTDLEPRRQKLPLAHSIREEIEGEIQLTLDLPEGLGALGEKVQEDLAVIDVEVELNMLAADEFEARVLSGESDMYFFGWKYDLADSADFFEAVIHTQEGDYGVFNGINYSNGFMDGVIEDVGVVMDVIERSVMLKQMTDLLLQDHVVVPLFESKLLYGLQPGIYWDLRLDGQILASEIVENVVE